MQVLIRIVDDCLNEAERCGLRSLTFPAIGTGNLGFPPAEVARLMLDDVLNFSQKKGSNSVQEVVFTLHPSDARTTQVSSTQSAFLYITDGLSQWSKLLYVSFTGLYR